MMRAFFFMLLAANLVYLVWVLANPLEPPTSPAPRIPPSAERLILWSESGDGADGTVAQTMDVGPSEDSFARPETDRGHAVNEPVGEGVADREAEPGTSPPRCYSIGPFAAEGTARQAAEALRGVDPGVEVREARQRRPTSYWVYLTGFDGPGQARETVGELKAGGVRDYYIETVGEYRNTISLGLYTYRSRAAKRADDIRKLGFDPQIRPNLRNVIEYWIDYVAGEDVEMSPAQWRDLVQAPDSVEQLERDCH
jgi:hypothetical protein